MVKRRGEKMDISYAVSTFARTVAKVAYTYTKNVPDAEDIAQEVFITLMNSGKVFEGDEYLKAWLIRVTINKCKNHLKSSWISRRSEMPDFVASQPVSDDKELLFALLSLDEKYRVPLHLYYYEGYSIKEIAGILGKKPATVGSQLDRGRNLLKSMLGGYTLE